MILIITACSTKVSNFSDNEKKIQGEKIDIDCLIGKPTEIIYLDTLLLFYDRYEQQAITVFDTKNNRFVRRFLHEGIGPGEVITPLKLFTTKDKKVAVFQIQTGYLNIYDAENIAAMKPETDIFSQTSFADRPANIKKIKDGFVGIGLFDDGRFRIYNEKGEIVEAVGKYPFRGEDMEAHDRFFIYQGFICSSMNGEYFALGSSYCDNLEFYHVENNHASLLKKYEAQDVKAQFNQRIEISDDCVMNYKAAYGGDKYCYMLYSGKTYLEKNRRTTGGRKIIVFDWKGNYVKSFEAEMDIFSFCVDEHAGIIYAIAYDSEDGFNITRFNI
jgi:hypothetical protein